MSYINYTINQLECNIQICREMLDKVEQAHLDLSDQEHFKQHIYVQLLNVYSRMLCEFRYTNAMKVLENRA